MSTNKITIETARQRVFLAFAFIICVGLLLFIAKLYAGNSISTQSIYPELSDVAVSLAPGDPQTHFASAVSNENSFLLENLKKSLAEFEVAVALSPYDYRLWFSLGKARSRVGNLPGAEGALRRALELAPSYGQIRWTLGNVLIRMGRSDEGFAEIRSAAESNDAYVNSVVVMAWEVVGGDIPRIRNYFADSPRINAKLAAFLGKQKEFEQAIAVWETLPVPEMKTTYLPDGEILMNQLVAEKRFRDALNVQIQIAGPDAPTFLVRQVFNGGFEQDINLVNPGTFEWKLGEGIQPQIGFDNTSKNGGTRSLVMLYNSPNGIDFRTLTQTIAVESDKSYRFSMSYRSNLKTDSTFVWEVVNTLDGSLLATTERLTADKGEWTKLTADFSTPAGAQGIIIRLVKKECPGQLCPISGRIWFDDFTLEPITN